MFLVWTLQNYVVVLELGSEARDLYHTYNATTLWIVTSLKSTSPTTSSARDHS